MSVHRREQTRISAVAIGVLAVCLGVAATTAEARRGADEFHGVQPAVTTQIVPDTSAISVPPAPAPTPEPPEVVWGEDDVLRIDGHIVVNKSFALPPTFDPGGLDPAVAEAFDVMAADAAAAGHELRIVSGYRSHAQQLRNYENRVAEVGTAIADRGMARPGHSEHQTGLAIDVNGISTDFGSSPAGQWVADNAHRFGFVVRYPDGKEEVTGFKYEPWHLRYFGVDLATELFTQNLTLEERWGLPSQY